MYELYVRDVDNNLLYCIHLKKEYIKPFLLSLRGSEYDIEAEDFVSNAVNVIDWNNDVIYYTHWVKITDIGVHNA